jgi:predicted membrane channel-forming protein YqfA (hemolysin III family)
MVYRHPTLYRILALVFLCIMLVLIFMSAYPAWPVSTRATLFMLSLFSLMLSLSYFHLGNQEDRGY